MATNNSINLPGGTANQVVYTTSTAYTSLTNGTTGQFLGANTGAAPSWQTPAGGGGAGTTGFFVYPSANLTNVTGDGTLYTVQFNTSVYDPGSNFSSNTTSTAPSTGFYVFFGQLAQDGAAENYTTYVNLVTTPKTYRVIQGNWYNFGSTVSGSLLTVATFCQPVNLTAGDTVQMKFAQDNGGGVPNVSIYGGSTPYYTSFSGFKVA